MVLAHLNLNILSSVLIYGHIIKMSLSVSTSNCSYSTTIQFSVLC